jgi:hypothetical protein
MFYSLPLPKVVKNLKAQIVEEKKDEKAIFIRNWDPSFDFHLMASEVQNNLKSQS